MSDKKLPQAELVLDNSDAGAPDGVRCLDRDGRQLVFRHAGLQVELMLQTSRPGPVVWGKMLQAASGEPCADARATLLDRFERSSAESRTDAWGEFCLAAAGGMGGVLRMEYGDDSFECALGTGSSRLMAAAEALIR
jgi:hypothetical protein